MIMPAASERPAPVEDLVRLALAAMENRDLKPAADLLETALESAPAPLADQICEVLVTVLVSLNDDRAIVRLLARRSCWTPQMTKARLVVLRNRSIGMEGETPPGCAMPEIEARVRAHILAGAYSAEDLSAIASLLAQLGQGPLAADIVEYCAEQGLVLDEGSAGRTLTVLLSEGLSQRASEVLGVLARSPQAKDLPLRRWWLLIRGEAAERVVAARTPDKVLAFIEQLGSGGSRGGPAQSEPAEACLRPQDLVPGLPSVRGSVYSQYLPDSIYCFGAHPEFEQILPKFVRENAANNGGDLARLIALVLNIKNVLEEAIPGDFAELGVWRGNTAAVLAWFAAKMGRSAYLFDTFEGFDQRDVERDPVGMGTGPAAFSDTSLDLAKSVVDEASPSIHWVKGYFPDSLRAPHRQARYAVVNLDCDLYEPMKAGLNFFYPRMSAGGIFLLHDYGSMFWGGAKKAIDEFLRETGERAVLMPDKSGSAFVRKCMTR